MCVSHQDAVDADAAGGSALVNRGDWFIFTIIALELLAAGSYLYERKPATAGMWACLAFSNISWLISVGTIKWPSR